MISKPLGTVVMDRNSTLKEDSTSCNGDERCRDRLAAARRAPLPTTRCASTTRKARAASPSRSDTRNESRSEETHCRRAAPASVPPEAVAVAVFRLPFDWDSGRVAAEMSRFGAVLHCEPKASRKDDMRVVTFVVYENEQAALDCVDQLAGRKLETLDEAGNVIHRSARLGAKIADDFTAEIKRRAADAHLQSPPPLSSGAAATAATDAAE